MFKAWSSISWVFREVLSPFLPCFRAALVCGLDALARITVCVQGQNLKSHYLHLKRRREGRGSPVYFDSQPILV